jgi:hypothetical protein
MFASDGAYITTFSGFGDYTVYPTSVMDGFLNNPTGTASDSVGNIWVADSNNVRIQRFSRDNGVVPVPNFAASVTLDEFSYLVGDVATVSYDITTGPYWNTGAYSYRLDVVDFYGEVLDTQPLTTQTGTKSVTFAEGDTLGVFYAAIMATPLAGGDSVCLNFDIGELASYVDITGFVMDAETGVVISGANVSGSQLSTTVYGESLATGQFNISGFLTGASLYTTAIKSGYRASSTAFIPSVSKTLHINISMIPTTPTVSGVAIGGIVRDTPLFRPVSGATVEASNATNVLSGTTNIAGYYLINDVANLTTYTVRSSKTGFVNSSDYSVAVNGSVSNFTWQNTEMGQIYTLTLNIADSEGLPIPVATVVASTGTSITTTAGTAVFSLPYGVVGISVTSSGYYGLSRSYIIDEDRTETIQLTKEAASSGKNVWYSMQLVRIKVVDAFGSPLPNATVSMNYLASTLPSTDISWLTSAFGVDTTVAAQMTNSSMAMSGTTTNDGSLTFMMFPALTYGVTIANPTLGLNNYRTISPRDTDYVLYCPLSTQIARNNTLTAVTASSLPYYKLNTSYYNLSMIYHDAAGYTTNVRFIVIDYTNGGTTVLDRNWGNPGTGIVVDNYTAYVPMGQEYIWKYNATKV